MDDDDPVYKKFVGFYWTFPVPSVGFIDLPSDPAAAAAKSRTIRYQREMVYRRVTSEKGELVAEIVYLDTAPDRGTDAVRPELLRALHACRANEAQLLYVDFAEHIGWRRHPYIDQIMKLEPVSCLGLAPEAITMDGALFDPIAHFRQWEAERRHRRLSANERRETLLRRVAETLAGVKAKGGGLAEAAERLNEDGVRTVTGKAWTAANVKMFLGKQGDRN
ncbi:MAG: recombinase family protein [Caulobacter sp.]|nr:recombinase family protein [Caulobacter sp.]